MNEEQKRALEEQRKTELHARNVISNDQSDSPKILEYLAEIDDSPELDDNTLDYMLSKVVSTANLTEAEVRGIEWENEIAMLRRRQAHPPEYGLTGHLRAVAFRDASAYRLPISETERIKHEGHGTVAKLAATRSEDFLGVEKSTQDITESILSDNQSESSGGIMSRWRD